VRRINLLPEAARRRTGVTVQVERYRSFLGIGAIVLGLLIVVGAYLWQSRSISSLSGRTRDVERELEELQPVLAAVDTLQDLKTMLLTKIEVVDKLMVGRFLWAKKLNQLSDLLASEPDFRDHIFLTQLERDLERKTIVEMVPAKGQGAGGQLTTKRTTVSVPVLRLGGAVFTPGSERAIDLVGELQRAIEEDSSFFAEFETVDFREAQSEEVFGRTVWGFELYCEFRPNILR
jgi:Tfp pilus assembly protein PilN